MISILINLVFTRELYRVLKVFSLHILSIAIQIIFLIILFRFSYSYQVFFNFYKDIAYKILLFGGFLTGFLTWCIARESYHIGASGIVYLLFSFVFFSGIIRKHFRLVAISLIIIFLYGSMIWYVLPIKEGMSWEGHLSGFFSWINISNNLQKTRNC